MYPGLTQLPEPARTSWFRFDHFYSTQRSEAALTIVFATARGTSSTSAATPACGRGLRAARRSRARDDRRPSRADRRGAPEHSSIAVSDRIALLCRWTCSTPSKLAERRRHDLDEPVLGLLRRGADSSNTARVAAKQPRGGRLRLRARALLRSATARCRRLQPQRDVAVLHVHRERREPHVPSRRFARLIRQAGLHVQAQHDNLGLGHTLLHCVKRE